MKSGIDKISIISTIIIVALISMTGLYAYYFTDWKDDRFFQDVAQRQVIPEFQEDSRIIDNRIILKKDKGIIVNRSRLVFKGMKDQRIHLDVYLLELDPDHAYPCSIAKEEGHQNIRLGDSTFQILKASKNILQLKIVDLYKS